MANKLYINIGMIILPNYITFLGLSRQSFFLCVMAPQFSQAPFLNFVVTFDCKRLFSTVNIQFDKQLSILKTSNRNYTNIIKLKCFLVCLYNLKNYIYIYKQQDYHR